MILMTNNLDQMVGAVIELESSKEYFSSKDTTKERSEAREAIRESLRKKTSLISGYLDIKNCQAILK